jgi:hypothetical protein
MAPTTEELVAARQREREAERKAAESPHELTADDVTDLRPSVVSGLMERGELAHLGYGRSKGKYR